MYRARDWIARSPSNFVPSELIDFDKLAVSNHDLLVRKTLWMGTPSCLGKEVRTLVSIRIKLAAHGVPLLAASRRQGGMACTAERFFGFQRAIFRDDFSALVFPSAVGPPR
jgi:hypothetical protein